MEENKVYVKWDPEFSDFANTPVSVFDISYQDVSGVSSSKVVTSNGINFDTDEGEPRLIITFPAQSPTIYSGGNHQLRYRKSVGNGGIKVNARWLRSFPFSADTHIVKEASVTNSA